MQAVSFPTQNGCHLSRAAVRTFKHNDVADLKRVLDAVAAEDRRVRCAAAPRVSYPRVMPHCSQIWPCALLCTADACGSSQESMQALGVPEPSFRAHCSRRALVSCVYESRRGGNTVARESACKGNIGRVLSCAGSR
jgi:hypothetical protein